MSVDRVVPEALQRKLDDLLKTKAGGRAAHWNVLHPVIAWNAAGAPELKLRCYNGCLLSASNPSDTAKTHFIKQDGKLVCRKRSLQQAGLSEEDAGALYLQAKACAR